MLVLNFIPFNHSFNAFLQTDVSEDKIVQLGLPKWGTEHYIVINSMRVQMLGERPNLDHNPNEFFDLWS